MAVELPEWDNDIAPPSPPTPWVWALLFVVFMAVGIAYNLLTWSKNEPTNTTWFWLCVLVCPASAWAVAFGLRLHYFQEETSRVEAARAVYEEDQTETIEFASEPLAVLGSAYLCAMGSEGIAARVAGNASALSAKADPDGDQASRHTTLALIDDDPQSDRFLETTLELLGQLQPILDAVPTHVPLQVLLQIGSNMPADSCQKTWESSWREHGFAPASLSLLSADKGLMVLDEWLDIRGGPALEKLVLVVAVQLYDAPPAESAEAAAALLLGWAPLASRYLMQAHALVHRPVEATADALRVDLDKALLWGRTTAADVADTWLISLNKQDKAALPKAAADIHMGVSKTEDLSGQHVIDQALGKAGAAAAWLATALAVEHANQTSKPQLVACREQTVRLMVVQPPATT
jgi:hypothetical protein